MPNFTNPLQFLCWFCREMLKTLSNEPSFFSSKRLERLAIFVNANLWLDICIYQLLKQDKIDYIAACALYTAQMIYAGYTMKQTFNEKPKSEIDVKKDSNTGDETANINLTENK